MTDSRVAALPRVLLKGYHLLVVAGLSALLMVMAVSALIPYSYATVVGVGPNVSIVNLPRDRQQVEPTIAVHPWNSNIIVAGAQDYRLKSSGGHRWNGYYRSMDGGYTWTQSLLPGFPGDNSSQGLASPLRRFNATSDPVIAFDRNSNVYYAGIAFNITGTSASSLTAFVARYVNDGANYTGTTLVGGVTVADKPWIAVDDTGGPNDGNVYLAFDGTIGNMFATVFARSVDGGATFSTPFFVPADGSGELPGITVSPSGDVFVSTPTFDPVTGQDLHRIRVSKLTNGGTTLTQTIVAADPVTSLPSPLPGNSFRTITIPQIAADSRGLYLVWDDFRSGDADVLVSRSTDGGSTWTSPLRVNDVSTGQQFLPTVATSGGIVSIAWYDSRLNTGTTITALDVFYTQSTDGGLTFSSNSRITSSSFDPNLVKRTDAPNINEPFLGDYIHIAASPTAVHPIWTDNRNACDNVDPVFGCVDQDVFTAAITVSAPPFHDVTVPNMKTSRGFAYGGVLSNPIKVNVTVSNLGSTTETITVRALANTTLIGAQNVTLAAGVVAIVQFSWDAPSLPRGSYLLSAQVLQVAGETLVTNNVFTDGGFTVKFNGDLNGDCRVTLSDIATIALAYDSNQGSANWNPNADLTNDGRVNLLDIASAALNYEKSCG